MQSAKLDFLFCIFYFYKFFYEKLRWSVINFLVKKSFLLMNFIPAFRSSHVNNAFIRVENVESIKKFVVLWKFLSLIDFKKF